MAHAREHGGDLNEKVSLAGLRFTMKEDVDTYFATTYECSLEQGCLNIFCATDEVGELGTWKTT